MSQPKNPCETCKHFDMGYIHEYVWKTCQKDWSDKQHGKLWGVLKNTCNNHKEKK